MTLPEHIISLNTLRFAWHGQPKPLLDIDSFDVMRGERLFVRSINA